MGVCCQRSRLSRHFNRFSFFLVSLARWTCAIRPGVLLRDNMLHYLFAGVIDRLFMR